MKNFALTGLAGYIAPRHLKAIKETGNRVVAAMDPHDSVGIIDQYFPDASFFSEYERFDRHLEKLRRDDQGDKIDYVSICSPNHLHDAHIRTALRIGADAICEKPLVLNPWNLDILQKLEREYEKRVFTVLQLRLHPSLLELRGKLLSSDISNTRHKIRLTYVTSRGKWYRYSWKGAEEKSGGIATNIGIHFFDMLGWLFGSTQFAELHVKEKECMGGFLELENADVEWFLSINSKDLPEKIGEKQTTYRSIVVDGSEIEFSGGFTDLHTRVYEEMLQGNGFGIDDARSSVELVHKLRGMPLADKKRGSIHPFSEKRLNETLQLS